MITFKTDFGAHVFRADEAFTLEKRENAITKTTTHLIFIGKKAALKKRVIFQFKTKAEADKKMLFLEKLTKAFHNNLGRV